MLKFTTDLRCAKLFNEDNELTEEFLTKLENDNDVIVCENEQYILTEKALSKYPQLTNEYLYSFNTFIEWELSNYDVEIGSNMGGTAIIIHSVELENIAKTFINEELENRFIGDPRETMKKLVMDVKTIAITRAFKKLIKDVKEKEGIEISLI